jgi:5'-nucleotidase
MRFLPARVGVASFVAVALSFAACSSRKDAPASVAEDAGVDAPFEDGTSDAGVADADGDSVPDAASDASADGGVVEIQILAINDFHGNLRPPSPTNSPVLVKQGDPAINDAGAPEPSGANVIVHAGGAAFLAAHLAALRAENPDGTILVSAGDLTGASPLVSSLYDDEPTIEVMNAMGLALNGVGNHEFDHGLGTLLHYQAGGCDPSDGLDGGFGSCGADQAFPGASFEYLAANVDMSASGDGGASTIFPPYAIKDVGGARVAFIGLTLSDPTPYVPAEIVGLTFENEITTTNALVDQLDGMGVDAIIVLIHQGGAQTTTGTYDECEGLGGAILAIASGIDPRVAAIHSAHTHQAYNCVKNGRPLTSAAAFGRLITKLVLSVDTTAHHVLSATATNVVVTRDIAPDPTVAALVDMYANDVASIADRQVGQISADILDALQPNGESPMGDVIADAMLAAAKTQGIPAVAAFMNGGGIRDSLYYAPYGTEPPGDVTYEKAAAVQPFGNELEVVACKGSDILAALNQNLFASQVFQVSQGFSYSWSSSSGLDANSVLLDGAPLDPAATYSVVLNSILATGGGGYSAFLSCGAPVSAGVDLAALTAYLTAHESPPLAPPAADRITKTN